jgi:hypothetical protein
LALWKWHLESNFQKYDNKTDQSFFLGKQNGSVNTYSWNKTAKEEGHQTSIGPTYYGHHHSTINLLKTERPKAQFANRKTIQLSSS